jgi:cytochrome c biogenesis protein
MKLFRSVKFNVALFSVLAAASALGTFLPQRHEAPAKVEEFLAANPVAGPWMDRLGLFELFHAGWYVALLGLMAFDVVVCKLRSLPKEVHAEDELSDRIVATSPLKDRLQVAAPLEDAAARVKAALARGGYSVRERRSEGAAAQAREDADRPGAGSEVHLWGVKHRVQRWGDFVLHVSIVAILIGAFFGSLRGFEEFVPVTTGGQKNLENRPWTVAVDEFIVDFYKETGTARTYASQLRVLDNGVIVGEKKIVVNDPLDIGGVRFYQASWGMTGMLRSATLEIPRKDGENALIHIPRGEKVALEGTGLSVAAEMLLPDFTINSAGMPDTASLEPNNPAVLVSFYQKDARVASLWLPRREPHMAFKVMPDQSVAPAAHPPFRLRSFDPVLFSGLQVTYDPGVKVVGWGCALLILGLVIHFYLHQRRVRVLLRAAEGGTLVQVGGWSSRHPLDFDAELQELLAPLRAAAPERP